MSSNEDARAKYDEKHPPVTVRLFEVLASVAARTLWSGSIGMTVRRDLHRYYTLMREVIGTIGLSRNEACAVMDACNGLYIDDSMHLSSTHLWAEVADACRLSGLDGKWDIDGQALVHKLQELSPAQCCALADAIGYFWAHPERDADELLHEIGIV